MLRIVTGFFAGVPLTILSTRVKPHGHSLPSALEREQDVLIAGRVLHIVAHLPLRYTLPAPEQA